MMSEYKQKIGEPIPPRIYEIVLDTDVSGTIAATQTQFMSEVFAASKKSNIIGHGLNIILKKDGKR